MKFIWKTTLAIVIASLLFACTKKSAITYDGFCRGVYELSNDRQTMQGPDPLRPPNEEPPSYDRYRLDRQEMLKESEPKHKGEEKRHRPPFDPPPDEAKRPKLAEHPDPWDACGRENR